jgi:hypothetical protein
MGTASVAPVVAPLVPGVQKPPRGVGKQFQDCLVAALMEKVKKQADLKTRPAWLLAGLPGCEPSGLPQQRGLPGVASVAVQAFRQLTAITSSQDPTRMVKERDLRRRTM